MEDRYFQWIAGERKGEVMVLDRIESEAADVFIVFKDNSRINENLVAPINQVDLTGKYMAEIDSPKNVWTFKDEWVGRQEEVWAEQDETNPGNKVCVQPAVPGRKVLKLVPPTPTPKNHSVFGAITRVQPSSASEPIPIDYLPKVPQQSKQLNISDPVYILMSKAKKIDSDVNMGMVISLPPKNLYELAKESFDDGDEKFIQYIVEEITVDEIKESLKAAIKEMYEGIQNESIKL
jgi:hypothetical protein